MFVLASMVQAFYHVSMWSAYSNLIDIEIEKLLYMILLVSYTWYVPTSWSHLDHLALQSHFNNILSSEWFYMEKS
jgi:hypothetical protein